MNIGACMCVYCVGGSAHVRACVGWGLRGVGACICLPSWVPAFSQKWRPALTCLPAGYGPLLDLQVPAQTQQRCCSILLLSMRTRVQGVAAPGIHWSRSSNAVPKYLLMAFAAEGVMGSAGRPR